MDIGWYQPADVICFRVQQTVRQLVQLYETAVPLSVNDGFRIDNPLPFQSLNVPFRQFEVTSLYLVILWVGFHFYTPVRLAYKSQSGQSFHSLAVTVCQLQWQQTRGLSHTQHFQVFFGQRVEVMFRKSKWLEQLPCIFVNGIYFKHKNLLI